MRTVLSCAGPFFLPLFTSVVEVAFSEVHGSKLPRVAPSLRLCGWGESYI
jgi:hypothetical protein